MSIVPLTPAPSLPEPTTPYPPRFRWFKRGVVLFLVAAVALGGLRWWWGWVADRRMRAEIDAIHARGEPAVPEDFIDPPLADSENAAVYLKQAAAGFVQVSGQANLDNRTGGDLFTPAELAIEGTFVAANRVPLRLARQASGCARATWGDSYAVPPAATQFRGLDSQRDVANRLADAAVYYHQTSNDSQAVLTLCDLMRVSDAAQQYLPALLTHLVAIAIGELGTEKTITLAPAMSIAPAGRSARVSDGAATQAQVRQLVNVLLDERFARDNWVRAFWGERAFVGDLSSFVPNAALRSVVCPALQLDAVRGFHRLSQTAFACTAADFPMTVARLPPELSGDHGALSGAAHPISVTISPMILRVHFYFIAQRRAAAVALGIRMYQVDHGGKLPATLGQLVPNYLPAVPHDPFASDGSALRYIPGRVARIYSVGENGVDDGGSRKPVGAAPMSRLDLVFRLTGPTTQPSSEAGDDKGDE